MGRRKWSVAVAKLVLLAGCVPAVMAPTVVATPGAGKAPADFAADHNTCAVLADQQIAPAKTAANNQIVGSVLLNAALGSGGAAAAGGSNGDVAANAVANGLGAGAATAQSAQATLQRQYDFDYAQCMYAKGNNVPGFLPVVTAPEPEATPAAAQYKVRRYAHKKPAPEKPADVVAAQPASAPSAGGFVVPAPAQTTSASNSFAVPPPATH